MWLIDCKYGTIPVKLRLAFRTTSYSNGSIASSLDVLADYFLCGNFAKPLNIFTLFFINMKFCFFCIVHIYPPFTRKRIVSLYFGWEVRTRLGVAISEMSGPPVFHIKAGASC